MFKRKRLLYILFLIVSLSVSACNVKPKSVTYVITYHLDGGTNHKDNPFSYKSNTSPIILQDPTKAGFSFNGWFTTSWFTDSNKITTITKENKTNLNLYARWVAITTGNLSCNAFAIDDNNSCPLVVLPYYEPVKTLFGEDLQDGLHTILQEALPNIPNTANGYKIEVVNRLLYLDEDPNNSDNIIEHFTLSSVPKTHYIGTPYNYPQGNIDRWDKEHVWAKSHGGQTGDIKRFEQMKAWTDIVNLRPSFGYINNQRSNRDYGDVNSISLYVTHNGEQVFGGYKDSNFFTPTDQIKGDVARILMYMVTMYNGDEGSQYLKLDLNDTNNGSIPYHGKISVLMQWHLDDPVDEYELRRNNRIEEVQGNRNPFVDYPHFAELIWPDYFIH